jgi:hypothetical protein
VFINMRLTEGATPTVAPTTSSTTAPATVSTTSAGASISTALIAVVAVLVLRRRG